MLLSLLLLLLLLFDFLMGYICSFGSIFIGKIYRTNLRIAFGFIEFELELFWVLYIFGYLLWAYFFCFAWAHSTIDIMLAKHGFMTHR